MNLLVSLALLATAASAIEFDPDVAPEVRVQFESDLKFMESLEGQNASPLFLEIFGSFKRGRLSRWFNDRVHTVGKNLCMADNAVACVLSAWDHKIWLSPNYSRYPHPRIARIMVILHEARHTEYQEQHWPHAKCPTPFLDADGSEIRSIWSGAPLAGERACDDSERGSYGTAALFLLNIAKNCSACDDETRKTAAAYGNDQLKRIIWPPARQRLEADLAE